MSQIVKIESDILHNKIRQVLLQRFRLCFEFGTTATAVPNYALEYGYPVVRNVGWYEMNTM